MTDGPGGIEVSLFVTCIVDQFYPEVGESTVRVLKRLGVDVDFPAGQTCCGQPAFNSGFWSDARPLARRFLEVFSRDRYIVVPSGSCASMVRVFYSDLLQDEPDHLERWRAVADRTYELSEFIVDVLGIEDVGPWSGEAQQLGVQRVTYHEACHLSRELHVTTQPRTLMNSLPGVELVEMERAEECCGFGGAFSVKYPDISGAMLQDKINSVRTTGADAVVACDSGCLMQMAGGMQRQSIDVRTLHLAQLLDERMGSS